MSSTSFFASAAELLADCDVVARACHTQVVEGSGARVPSFSYQRDAGFLLDIPSAGDDAGMAAFMGSDGCYELLDDWESGLISQGVQPVPSIQGVRIALQCLGLLSRWHRIRGDSLDEETKIVSLPSPSFTSFY